MNCVCVCVSWVDIYIACTDICRLTTGIRSEICVVRRFRRCANVYLHNPRYRDADKSLAQPGRKQATATEDFEFHISYL